MLLMLVGGCCCASGGVGGAIAASRWCYQCHCGITLVVLLMPARRSHCASGSVNDAIAASLWWWSHGGGDNVADARVGTPLSRSTSGPGGVHDSITAPQ